uniref:Carboxylic ester hydrolase n=1 Tax=Scolopendra viridis TaxID=118503 RepID=A0A4D5R9W9_SCOVI
MLIYIFPVISFLFVTSECSYLSSDIIVRIRDGYLRGDMMTSEKGDFFFAFRGIPYAEPPIGKLRFKPPVPNKPWKGVRNATTDRPSCPQLDYFTGGQKFIGSEDCLYLNVYTPQFPENNETKYDVLFHIHGGGFTFGNGGSSSFGPRRFPLKNIILVSITYRVSSLGFLSTKDSFSPGNYGLLDQLEGLRWVRNNIRYFGGDPSRVTLLGQSAGSASVLYHVLSPLTEGLFHRAIALSGSPLIPYALQKDPLYWTTKLAHYVDCPIKDSEILVECLRKKSAEEIIINSSEFEGINLVYAFAPTVDNYFITDIPLNILKNGTFKKNIPILMGVTEGEAFCWSSNKNSSEKFTDDEILQNLKVIVDVRPNVNEILKEIKAEYFAQTPSRDNDIVQKILRTAMTEGKYHIPVYYTAKLMMEYGIRLYLYRYDYLAPWFKPPEHSGVCHTDELYLLFDGSRRMVHFDAASEKFKEYYQRLIINFIKTGDPTPIKNFTLEWPPCEREDLYLYHIYETPFVENYKYLDNELYNFWKKIIEELNANTKNSSKNECCNSFENNKYFFTL